MNFNGSVTDFFYNIVPGSLFFFLLKYFGIDFFKSFNFDSASLIFAYIIFSLFAGFVFQSITKFVRRDLKWNDRIANRVLNRNSDEFRYILRKTFGNNIPRKQNTSAIKLIHLMDASLRGDSAAFLPTHFSSRFAFWSNMFLCFLLLLIVRVAKHDSFDRDYIFLVVGCAWTYFCVDESFDAFYDSILKSFFMKIKRR